MILFIRSMMNVGALVKPKGMIENSNNPYLVINRVSNTMGSSTFT